MTSMMSLGKGARYWLWAAGCIVGCVFARAQQGDDARLSMALQAAQADYAAGRPAEAAAQLEGVLPQPGDPAFSTLDSRYFPLLELMGLCYAASSQDARALPYLATALRQHPEQEEAHTNLAASLMKLGQRREAVDQFREALALVPEDYTANHNLGEALIQQGGIAEAVPFLNKAHQIKPAAYDNGYDLATAELIVGQDDAARGVVLSLLREKNTGELHDLEAQIDEKQGKYVDAANEFETAAHLDPSENILFDWGSELLLHRTYDPAIQIFRAAAERYPNSSRILIGLGISLYARGLYEDAVKALLAGADLNPTEPRCYMFLSKAFYSRQSHTDEVIERFRRYAELEPKNALAQYYFAMSLWKGGQAGGRDVDMARVEALLQRSLALDDTLAEAHFELGNLYAERHDYEKSVPQYLQVIALEPNHADAHYRLATGYTHLGDRAKAQAELAVYQKLRAQHLAASDKEGNELQQFVYTAKAPENNP